MTGHKPTLPRSPRRIHLPSNSAEAASDPFFPPQAPTEVSFLPTASLLLAGREARSRCSIKWQQFRKVDWTWLSDGPARQWWALRKVVHPKILGGGHLSFHLNVGNAYCQKEFPILGALNCLYRCSFAVRLNIIISLAEENKGLFMSLVRLTKTCYGCARTNTGDTWYKMQILWFDSACQSQFMNREISELWMPAKLELLCSGKIAEKKRTVGDWTFFLFWHDSLLFSLQVQSFFLPFFIDFLFSAVASVWPAMLSFFSYLPFFSTWFSTWCYKSQKHSGGWIHITLIDSRRKTPFIFDAVFLTLDEWIEDKECFQLKLFSCLSSPQSWKAEKKV